MRLFKQLFSSNHVKMTKESWSMIEAEFDILIQENSKLKSVVNSDDKMSLIMELKEDLYQTELTHKRYVKAKSEEIKSLRHTLKVKLSSEQLAWQTVAKMKKALSFAEDKLKFFSSINKTRHTTNITQVIQVVKEATELPQSYSKFETRA